MLFRELQTVKIIKKMSNIRNSVVLLTIKNSKNIEVHGSLKSIERKKLKYKRHSVDGFKEKYLTCSVIDYSGGVYEDENYIIEKKLIIKNR